MKPLSWGEKLFFLLKLPFRTQLAAWRRFGLYRGGPRQVSLAYAGPCANDCVFCRRKGGPWTPLADLKARLDENRRVGAEALNLVANEPLAHPELPALLAYARECGFREFTALNSGEIFARPGFARRLAASGFSTVSIPVYGLRAAHDRAVGRRGSFGRVLRGLRALRRERGVRVFLHTMVLRQNLAGFRAFLAALKKETGLSPAVIQLRPKENALPYEELMPPYPGIIAELAGSEQAFIDYPLCVLKRLSPRLFAELAACRGARRTYFFVDRGLVSRSSFFYGKLLPNPPRPPCRRCRLKAACPGVLPDYARAYGDAGLEPLR